MKLSTALRLGRVSNLPTVTSNVVAAIALAGRRPGAVTIALACMAMSLMYVAGMWLNDAFDRDLDRVERPERPIPSGEVAAGTVFDVGFALLAGGIVLIAALAFTSGAGWPPVLSAIALGSLIIFYDAHHKQNRWSPLIMGMCRAAVYTTAALLVRRDLCPEVLAGCGLLLAYLIGLTYVARQENLDELTNLWPLAFLAAPFVIARPHDTIGLAIYTGYMLWVFRSLVLIRRRAIREAVTGLIAGISLLDALLIINLGRPGLAIVALAAFFATAALQRVVPGT
ncbi:MAG TPA: UbiA family prenyltransferase [Kofleriaceae bacterium]|nr:UbiA family prenyltransferase [Kofleriaceae bacterium]